MTSNGEREPLLSDSRDEKRLFSWRAFGLGVAATAALAAVIVVASGSTPSAARWFNFLMPSGSSRLLGEDETATETRTAAECESHFNGEVKKFHEAVEEEFTMSHAEHEATYGEDHKGVWNRHNGCAVGPFLPDHTKLSKMEEVEVEKACDPGALVAAIEKEFEKVYKEHCEHWRDPIHQHLQWPQVCHGCDHVRVANGSYIPAGEPPHIGHNYIPGVTDVAGFCHFDPAKMGQCMKSGLVCYHKETEDKYVSCKEDNWPEGNSHFVTHNKDSKTSDLGPQDLLNGGHTHKKKS